MSALLDVAPARAGPLAPAGPRSRAMPGWPLAVYFAGYVLLWALGVANFAGPVLALPMLGWLARRERVLVPRGFGLWLLFLGWMLASGAMLLDRGSPFPLLGFGYRAATYVSAGVFLLYVYNLPRREVGDERVGRWVAALWVSTVVLGLAALVLPAGGFTSPLEYLIPAGFRGSGFIRQLVHPGLAQMQDFLGYPVPRPAAPFVYTNDWGSCFALLTPLFVATWLRGPSPGRRRLGALLAVASLAPLVVSLNRGAWLSLGIGLAYGLVLANRREGARIPVARIAAGVGLLGILALSPLGGLVADRFETPHSNASRLTLYEEAIDRVGDSPFYGYGAPQETTQVDRNIPPVGTQGMFWMVLFSHGVVGAALFLGWFLHTTAITRGSVERVASWAHVVVLIGLIQLPFYGLIPTQLHIIAVAAGLALRARATAEMAA